MGHIFVQKHFMCSSAMSYGSLIKVVFNQRLCRYALDMVSGRWLESLFKKKKNTSHGDLMRTPVAE